MRPAQVPINMNKVARLQNGLPKNIKTNPRLVSAQPDRRQERADQCHLRAKHAERAAQQKVSDPRTQMSAERKPIRDGMSEYLGWSAINQASAKQDAKSPATTPAFRAINGSFIALP
jgi:hypothetical protein